MDKISKSEVKMVRSLQQKKFRDELNFFVAEGDKCVSELVKGFELEMLVVNDPTVSFGVEDKTVLATPVEIGQMSSLRTPQGTIAVFRKRQWPQEKINESMVNDQLVLALDGIQDPGNLGTIIRTCDWYGVHDIVCSLDTADCYNPKVVQATMGALSRVRVHYVNLPEWLSGQKDQQVNIFGTLLEGKNMYKVLPSESRSVIIMGNEGNGISSAVRPLLTHPIRIPSFPENADTSESLNVSIATAIVLAEFRRPLFPIVR